MPLSSPFLKECPAPLFRPEEHAVAARFGPVYAGEPPHRVTGSANLMGRDLLISIQGGTAPHIGATALAWPDPATSGGVAVKSIVAPGHKDDIPARDMAAAFCAWLGRTVCVCVGLHVDNANSEDISQLLSNADNAANALANLMTKGETS